MLETSSVESQVSGKSAGKTVWPADRIERWPIGRLVPYARNARTHSDAQVGQIAASIREWGWTNPVLVDEEGTIIAGHGRVLAARKLRIAQVPVMVAAGWTEAQKRAYTIADNKLTLNGGWDEELLGLEIGELEVLGFDLDLIGFSDDERAALVARATDGLTDPDVVPDLPSNPVTRPCDVWVMGGHRLICGDSTSKDDVDALLAGVSPHLMVTDPPYGVSYDPAWRKRAGVNLNPLKLGKVINDDQADWREAWALFPGSVAYIWHASLHTSEVKQSLEAQGSACALKSSGPRIASHLAEATTIGSTNPVGIPSVEHRAHIGAGIASNRPCGPFLPVMMTGTVTERKNPWSACGGLSRTTLRRAKPSMIRSAGRARPLSQPK